MPPHDWDQVLLSDLCVELTVGFVGSMKSEYVNSGIPFLRSQNILPYRLSFEDIKYISSDFHNQLKKSSLSAGDVVIVRTGKPGTACVIPDGIAELNCSDLVIVRPGKKLNSRYLAYYINGVAQNHVNAHLVGAVQQHFNVGSAKQFALNLPSLDEQLAIVNCLGGLDDKIELNRQMNETLEEMARAVFKSWFVDFDPVHAKAKGQAPAHMSNETAALFPATFNEDGLPEAWKEKRVSDFIELIGGGTPKRKVPEYWNGDIPWFSVVDAPNHSDVWIIGTKEKITERGLNESSAKLLPEETTIITARGTVGKIAFVGTPTATNQSCYGIRGMEPWGQRFTYFLIRKMVDELKSKAHGSVFDTITRETFSNVWFPEPRSEIASAFEELVTPLLKKIKANVEQNQTLTELRDTLLPKLMSGQIRLKGVQAEVVHIPCI